MELHQYGVQTDILTLEKLSLLKWHRRHVHMNFQSIVPFARPRIILFVLMTIREEDIPICAVCCFRKHSCTYPKTYGSGIVISDEHYQMGIYISINQIESPQGRLIPVLKGN